MRYPQGGGLTAKQREFREQVRLSAIDFFQVGDDNKVVASAQRVSVRSVERWRAAWEDDGEQGLCSKGPASMPKLSPSQFQALETSCARVRPHSAGPTSAGCWQGQDGDRSPVGHKSYTVCGVWGLMRRDGLSWQDPACRAVERDEAAIELWKKEVWPAVERQPRLQGPGSSLRTNPDAS